MTGTAIQPVARNALIERSRNASGATIAAMRRPGARHFAKLTMVKLRSGMSWDTAAVTATTDIRRRHLPAEKRRAANDLGDGLPPLRRHHRSRRCLQGRHAIENARLGFGKRAIETFGISPDASVATP